MKPWTFLVYLAGDNNLDAAAAADLLEMKAVGSGAAVDVVAQLDGRGDGATRYHITPGPATPAALGADVVAELPEANTGDPADLVDFVAWAAEAYPSERLALVLWNHGAGWKDDDIYAAARGAGLAADDLAGGVGAVVRSAGARPAGWRRGLFRPGPADLLAVPAAQRAILFDDTSRDFLDNQELRLALDTIRERRGGRAVDVVGCDACLMSMVEVAYQLHGLCGVFAGSQEVEPADGWPYGDVLRRLAADPGQSAASLGRAIVDAYADQPAGAAGAAGTTGGPPDHLLTQSAIHVDRLPGLVAALDALAAQLVPAVDDPDLYARALLPAARGVRKFRDAQYVDLGHLAALLAGAAAPGPLAEAARSVAKLLAAGEPDGVVVASRVAPASVRAAGPGEGAGGGDGRSPGPRSAAPALPGAPPPARDFLPPAGEGGAGDTPRRSSRADDGRGVTGLSIYWPFVGPVSPAYAGLAFARDCRWPAFVDAFLEA